MPTTTYPISLDGLIAWLETQDPATPYVYGSATDCLNARFLKAQGLRVLSVGRFTWTEQTTGPDGVEGFETRELPHEMDVAAHDAERVEVDPLQPHIRTYGTALTEARAIKAATPAAG